MAASFALVSSIYGLWASDGTAAGTTQIEIGGLNTPERVLPVRIAAHAFGENKPVRALLLSPDHSVYMEDVLIPIKFLTNGTTVRQVDVSRITYYHIELARHDVVLAEGLPAETYLETGGRSAFENGGTETQLHPEFSRDEARVAQTWQRLGYAPLLGTDRQFGRVVARLAAQARMLLERSNHARPVNDGTNGATSLERGALSGNSR